MVSDENGINYEYQIIELLRNKYIEIIIKLKAKNKLNISISPNNYLLPKTLSIAEESFENDYYLVKWSIDKGIYYLYHKSSSVQLLSEDDASLGRPIYQLFKNGNRWLAGGYNFAKRIIPEDTIYKGQVIEIKVIENGNIHLKLQITYKVPGAEYFNVFYSFYKNLKVIDIKANHG